MTLTTLRKFTLFSHSHHPEKFRKHSWNMYQTKSADQNHLKSNSPNCLQVVRAQFAPNSGNSMFNFHRYKIYFLFRSKGGSKAYKLRSVSTSCTQSQIIFQPGLNSQSALGAVRYCSKTWRRSWPGELFQLVVDYSSSLLRDRSPSLLL